MLQTKISDTAKFHNLATVEAKKFIVLQRNSLAIEFRAESHFIATDVLENWFPTDCISDAFAVNNLRPPYTCIYRRLNIWRLRAEGVLIGSDS